MTLPITMLSSKELEEVGSKSTILLCCCFFIGFIWKKNSNKMTHFFFFFSFFLLDSTCCVADGGNYRSVYNDRDVRWTRQYWGRNPHWHSSILLYQSYWNKCFNFYRQYYELVCTKIIMSFPLIFPINFKNVLLIAFCWSLAVISCWSDYLTAEWYNAERILSRHWYIPFDCAQYMCDHHLEDNQPRNCLHRPRSV